MLILALFPVVLGLLFVPASAATFTDVGAAMNIPSATGAAWGDYDNDGYPDLFIGGVWQTHRCVLYHNNGDGSFTDVTFAMGFPTVYPYTEDWGCAWGDYDNDGDLDLAVAGGNHTVFMYRNDGSYFTEVGAAAGFVYYPTARGVAWGDYDRDNWLDLYVCYELSDVSRLFHNNQNGTFTDVTNAAGMEFSPAGLGQQGTWADYNNDGLLDLLVSRLWSGGYENPARLYRNNGNGTFNDYGAVAGIQSAGLCTGASWGDFDNDGNLDFYMAPEVGRPAWLFHSNGDGTFTNLYDTAGMKDLDRDINGVAWADYDNDGLLDLATANKGGQSAFLWHNSGNLTFTERHTQDGMTANRSYQVNCWADYDRDGATDLFAGASGNYSCLYHNDGPVGSFLRVRTLTDSDGDATDLNTSDDRDALGARVDVNLDNDLAFPPGRTLMRVIDGGSSWMGQNEPVAQFGLGTATLVALRVVFPDGAIVTQDDVPAGSDLVVRDIPQTFGSVSGTIRDDATGLPISGATVTCSYLAKRTPANGTYSFPQVPAGTGYIMTVRARGYHSAQLSGVTVNTGLTATVNVDLIPFPTDTVGLYDAIAGRFYLRNSNNAGPADLAFRFGAAGAAWLPLTGDWDADEDDTPGLFDPSRGLFFLRYENAGGNADLSFRFGPTPSTWYPLAGDWNGDGLATIGLYNPTTGTFYLRNTNSAGPADLTFRFGPTLSSWVPLTGDWDGNGDTTVGLYNPATGTFYLRNSNAAGTADLTFRFGPTSSPWKPVTGDWNHDLADSVGLYNPTTGTYYLRNSNSAGAADLTFRFGSAPSTCRPIAGDWDGQ